MASIINAATSGGLITTADTSGVLQLQTAGTTAVSISAAQVANFTNAPTIAGSPFNATSATNLAGGSAGVIPYQTGSGATTFSAVGTAGQVLTSAGSSAPTWSTLSSSGSGGTTASGSVTLTSSSAGSQTITTTNYNQSVTLPNATTVSKDAVVFHLRNVGSYPLKVKDNAGNVYGFLSPFTDSVVGLSDNSTAAGVWTITNLELVGQVASVPFTSITGATNTMQTVVLDSNRTFTVCSNYNGSQAVVGFVYDSTTTTTTLTTIAASGYGSTAYAISSSSVLVVYSNSSNVFTAVILSISGTTITVNTPVAAASGAFFDARQYIGNNTSSYSPFTVCGSTYVLRYSVNGTTSCALRAITVSGTVPTIGTAQTFTGTFNLNAYFISSSVFLAVYHTGTGATVTFAPYSVSGTTLTAGTQTTVTANDGSYTYRILPASASGRYWCLSVNGAALNVDLISVSGTTATKSNVSGAFTGTWTSVNLLNNSDIAVCGNRLVMYGFLAAGPTHYINIITDSSGTATAGTLITFTGLSSTFHVRTFSDSTTANFISGNNTAVTFLKVDASTASPVLSIVQYYANASGGNTAWPSNRAFDGALGTYQNLASNSALYSMFVGSGNMRGTISYSGSTVFSTSSTPVLYFGNSDSISRTSETNFYTVQSNIRPGHFLAYECATV
jgi:hypothetical protein